MTVKEILPITSRKEFRKWLENNHSVKHECWIAVKRGKTPPDDTLWYLSLIHI